MWNIRPEHTSSLCQSISDELGPGKARDVLGCGLYVLGIEYCMADLDFVVGFECIPCQVNHVQYFMSTTILQIGFLGLDWIKLYCQMC